MAGVATIVLPVGNITGKGIMGYRVVGNFSASLWLTNNRVVPVSNIAGIANPWVWTGKHKRPCCILVLLNYG